MSDTWSDIQAVKTKHSSLREKLQRLKRAREEIVADITGSTPSNVSVGTPGGAATSATLADTSSPNTSSSQLLTSQIASPASQAVTSTKSEPKVTSELVADIETRLQLILSDVTLDFPVESSFLINSTSKALGCEVPLSVVEDLLQKFAAQELISITTKDEVQPGQSKFTVVSANHSKLSAVTDEHEVQSGSDTRKRKHEGDGDSADVSGPQEKKAKQLPAKQKDSVESLLSMQSAKEKENKKLNEEILQLLSTPTAKEQSLVEKFRSQGGAQVQEFCQYGTREECARVREMPEPCGKLHFKKIIRKHTDESLGDCSFLNTCFHMDTCKYVHYEIDYPPIAPTMARNEVAAIEGVKKTGAGTMLFPNQWVQCDLRYFDMSVLGKFAVVMADPPWDIHMELPYGTMSDDEMRKLDVPSLQDDGYIFLWVTGRAMELGRECLKLWGYERIDEMIWVKTNQLQRIIRTGRTGHWLNHGKEHCLVGRKGNPKNVNRGLDCDVIVAEVRATSHKPDEIYGIIERLSPGTRKIELFGRPHNIQPNWITLGNQLDGVRLLEPEVVKAFRQRYPDGNCMRPPTT